MQNNCFCIFLGSFRDLFVAGEHMDKDTMSWTRKAISAPVYDNWWQTGRVILDLLTHLGIEVVYLNGIFSFHFAVRGFVNHLLYINYIKNSAYVICNEKLKRKFMVWERLFYKETVVLRCNGKVKTKPGIHRAKGNAIGRLYRPKTDNWCTEIRKTRHFSTTTGEEGKKRGPRNEVATTTPRTNHGFTPSLQRNRFSTTNNNCDCALLL